MSVSTTQQACKTLGPSVMVSGVMTRTCQTWEYIDHPEPTSISLTCPSTGTGTGTGSSSGYFLPPLTAEQGLQVGSLVFLSMATAWGFRHLVQFILNRR